MENKKIKKTRGYQNAQKEKRSIEELATLISNRVATRYNTITQKNECRWYDIPGEDLPVDLSGVGEFSNMWHDMTDREENTLWAMVSREQNWKSHEVGILLRSHITPQWNPLKEFILEASDHADFDSDPIADLASHVHVKATHQGQTDEEAQQEFVSYFKRWLVASVASVFCNDVVNNVILVLIGEQGTYKSTFFQYLLPPELRRYFYVKTDNTVLNKDDRLQLTRNMFVCLEELDAMSNKEQNQLKAMVTMPVIQDRPAYARNFVNLAHVASLCGTGNNENFLNDPTGSRRWLPFLVDHIDDPRSYATDYYKLYAQAFFLYGSSFRYWFTREEIIHLNERNKQFETPSIEEQLISKYYALSDTDYSGTWVNAATILEKINGGIKKPLSVNRVGQVMKKMGFESIRTKHGKSYHVLERKIIDIDEYQKTRPLEDTDQPF